MNENLYNTKYKEVLEEIDRIEFEYGVDEKKNRIPTMGKYMELLDSLDMIPHLKKEEIAKLTSIIDKMIKEIYNDGEIKENLGGIVKVGYNEDRIRDFARAKIRYNKLSKWEKFKAFITRKKPENIKIDRMTRIEIKKLYGGEKEEHERSL